MTDFRSLILALERGGVEFILVGGAAATAHGVTRLTQDLDIVYRRSEENLERIVNVLEPLRPYLRGAPPGLPFRFDVPSLRNGSNFTLTTSLGDLDLLGEITAGGRYEDLFGHTIQLVVFGAHVRCLDLETLIHVKRAVGRIKDREAIAELETLRMKHDSDRSSGNS